MAEPPPPPPLPGQEVEIIDAQVQVASTDYREMANNINNQQQNTNANTNGHQQEQPMIGPQPPPEGMQQQQQDMENMPDQHILQLWNDVAQNLREHQTGKFFFISAPNQRSHWPSLDIIWILYCNTPYTPYS